MRTSSAEVLTLGSYCIPAVSRQNVSLVKLASILSLDNATSHNVPGDSNKNNAVYPRLLARKMPVTFQLHHLPDTTNKSFRNDPLQATLSGTTNTLLRLPAGPGRFFLRRAKYAVQVQGQRGGRTIATHFFSRSHSRHVAVPMDGWTHPTGQCYKRSRVDIGVVTADNFGRAA